MRIASILFLFFLSMTASAQVRQIKGRVLDSLTQEPLSFVTVFSCVQVAGVTDESGNFTLAVPDSCRQLTVSYLGYLPKVIPVSDSFMTIRLTTASRFFEPIVVSAGKQEQREVETTVSIASIQPYLIQNRITSSIENTIQQMPGVTSVDGQANIRSGSGWSYGTGSRVAVLVDGYPMLASGTGQAHWSFFPVENVEQVEIIKGSSSVLYGSSALNGVINVRTAWPGNREKISASLYSGFYGTPPNPSWRWQGDRLLSRSGGHVLYGRGYERMQYVVSLNGLVDEGWRMGDEERRIRGSWKTRFLSKDKKWRYGINGSVQSGRTGDFLLWENYNLAYTSMDSSYALNNAVRIAVDPYLEYHHADFDHYLFLRYYKVENRIEQLEGEPDQANKTASVYGEYRFTWKKWQKTGWLYNLGLVQQYGESQATMFLGRRLNQNAAAYLQADYRKKRWNISLGARYEYYRLESYKQTKPVVKAGVNYRAAKATYLRASFGQGYRFPVVAESFIRTSAGPVNIYPNENLKAEAGYSLEVGVRQGFQTKGGLSLMADLAFYRMYFENMMEFTFGQWGTFTDPLFGLGFKSVNIGPAVIQGYEIALTGGGKWKKNDIKAILGYTYSDGRTVDPNLEYANSNGQSYTYAGSSSDTTGRILKYRNRHLIKGDLQWERSRWGAGVSYRYASRMEAVDEVFLLEAFFAGVTASREANKKGDHVVDLRLFYNITSDVKVTFVVNNLFNEEEITRPFDVQAPRNFSCQLSYKY